MDRPAVSISLSSISDKDLKILRQKYEDINRYIMENCPDSAFQFWGLNLTAANLLYLTEESRFSTVA